MEKENSIKRSLKLGSRVVFKAGMPLVGELAKYGGRRLMSKYWRDKYGPGTKIK